MESYIQQLFAERIGGANYGKDTAIYKFEKIKRAKAAAKAAHPDRELIDMGVGEPDEAAPPEVVQALAREAGKSENRFYTDNGIPEFKEAAARYMQNLCGVTIDPVNEVVHSIGSKAALSLLPACLINPGDVTLMTTPGYPVFGTHAKYYGGQVVQLPLTAERDFLPDIDSIAADVLAKTKVLVLNYPNNPTGGGATRAFFEKVVFWAKQHQIVVIHDAAYAGLIYEGNPLSILSVPGGKEVALELHSLSKSFNMTGWRIGFVCGNPLLVRAYADVKDNSDSGQFAAIQKAGAYCLDHPEITRQISQKYSRRMDLLIPVLRKHGFQAKKPVGSFFLYVPAPKGAELQTGKRIDFARGEDFSQFMISEMMISTVPWDDAGPCVRWSVTFSAAGEAKEREVIAEIDQRLSKARFEF
ncbi:LL-diaminopimelate aminotransferase [bacterium]|nr:LL-diaminopimelate aminotransferase [bacterium]